MKTQKKSHTSFLGRPSLEYPTFTCNNDSISSLNLLLPKGVPVCVESRISDSRSAPYPQQINPYTVSAWLFLYPPNINTKNVAQPTHPASHEHSQDDSTIKYLQKIKHPTVIDTTAGLGKDAFVLASLSCQITLIERSLPVYLVLHDALERVRESSDTEVQQIVSRMSLLHTNSQQHLEQLSSQDSTDIIYCDPMFPSREKSAKVKKEMTWLKALVGKDEDATEVLAVARLRARKRIVVKTA